MKQINENANGATIEAKKDEILQICLAENRTGGYQWTIRSEGKPVCRFLNDYFAPAKVGWGGKGSHHWEVRCVSSGTAGIEFEYARPWETTSPPQRRFSIQVTVQE